MRTFVFLIAFGLTFSALPVAAEKTPATLKLSAQVAELMQMRVAVENVLKQCSNPAGSSFDAKTAFNSSPGSFGGVSPQSSYWPEVEAIYADYAKGVCAYLTADGFMAYYVGVLAEKNTEQDLRLAAEFYSSPAGKRFQQSVLIANVDFQAYANDSMKKASKEATEKFHVAMRGLMRKYKSEQR